MQKMRQKRLCIARAGFGDRHQVPIRVQQSHAARMGQGRKVYDVRGPDKPAAGCQRRPLAGECNCGQPRQQGRQRDDPRCRFVRRAVEHVEADGIGQPEIAAARPNQPREMAAGAQPLADRVG